MTTIPKPTLTKFGENKDCVNPLVKNVLSVQCYVSQTVSFPCLGPEVEGWGHRLV